MANYLGMHTNIALWALLSLSTCHLAGCYYGDLAPVIEVVPDGTVDVKVAACTTEADAIQSRLKFVIIVDESGSNRQRYELPSLQPLPGTDPDGARRYDALLSFLTEYGDDDRVYFSLITFADDATLVQELTNDRAAFTAVVKNRRGHNDGGGTNYLAALDRLTELVENDVHEARQADEVISSSYVMIWVSDGAPIVGQSQSIQDTNQILGKIRPLAGLRRTAPQYVDAVVFNTGYYFSEPEDATARDLLQRMGEDGNGLSFKFVEGEQIDFKRFSVPTILSRYELGDVWVTNAQTVWELGVLKADTDGDGLSDELEMQGPSNRLRFDTDGNGISDGVEYLINTRMSPCSNPQCDRDYALFYGDCDAFQVDGEPRGTYTDSDGDLLNDCEEFLLKSDIRSADTNLDFIPDYMAFRHGIEITSANSLDQDDADLDGVNDYEELKRNTPRKTNNANVTNLFEVKHKKELILDTPERQCFSYEVSGLVYLDKYDIIRAYVLESPRFNTNKHLFHIAEESVSLGTRVEFDELDFE